MVWLFWLGIGLVVGLLVRMAHRWPANWGGAGWLVFAGAGALSGVVGGLLGMSVLGLAYSPLTAVWIAAVAVAVSATLVSRRQTTMRQG